MARDVKKQSMQQAAQAQQLAQQAQAETQRQQAAQETAKQAQVGRYQGILDNPGYSGAEKAAISTSAMAPLGARYESLQNAANLRATRTRNDAGHYELLGQLARSEGRQAGEIGARTEAGFADRAARDRNMALTGLSGIYGVDAATLARAMGIPTDLLGVSNQALGTAGAQRSSFGLSLDPFGSFGFG